MPIVVGQHPELKGLMKHMFDQEAGHLNTFNHLISKHRVRPTAMYPLRCILASGLGWTTAMMGKAAAMACTEAVETEIGGHYNEQIRRLLEMVREWEAEGFQAGPEISELVHTIRRIRDEELEHLDHAVENDSTAAPLHWILINGIKASC